MAGSFDDSFLISYGWIIAMLSLSLGNTIYVLARTTAKKGKVQLPLATWRKFTHPWSHFRSSLYISKAYYQLSPSFHYLISYGYLSKI